MRLEKHTLNLRSGDFTYLQIVYASKGITSSEVIRRLVSTHVNQLKQEQGKVNSKEASYEHERTL